MADIDLVFVTNNDFRPMLDNRDAAFHVQGILTNSHIWQQRAQHVQRMFDGLTFDPFYPRADELKIVSAANIDDAFFEVDRLSPDRIRNLFFVGHGSADDGFVFSGQPTGPGALDAFLPETPRERFMLELSDVVAGGTATSNANVSFIRKIADRFAPNSFNGIYFMSCFTGAGELPAAMEAQLKNFGAKDFIIVSWADFYQTNARGELGGNTNTSVAIDGTTHTVGVPRLNRFVEWRDQIIDPDTMSSVASAPPNGIPTSPELHGHGQASVLEPLGILD
ncbi:hypothetical protein [Ruegeria sp.]|uniref:hypothetical protein n=1 Tax=Ruegeria sp. TaxID=1879320 RepID=UPI0023172B6B|nr:hypothetical protein [Ruegeria sp.]MDA7966959.1 hypothetical protein [Ruegeria sp.]